MVSTSKTSVDGSASSSTRKQSRSRVVGSGPAQTTKGSSFYEPISREAELFGQALKAARVLAGLSQSQIGRDLNRSQGTIAAWENGVNVPIPQDIFEVERIVGVPAGSLSSHLGFVPVSGQNRTTPAQVAEAIMNDVGLDDTDKKVVLDLYRSLRNRKR